MKKIRLNVLGVSDTNKNGIHIIEVKEANVGSNVERRGTKHDGKSWSNNNGSLKLVT